MNESPFEKIKKYFDETTIAKFDTLFIDSSVEEIFCNKEYHWFLIRDVCCYQYIHVSGIELDDIGDDYINIVIYSEETCGDCEHWTTHESYPLKWFTDENEMKAAIKEYEEEEKERKREVEKEKRYNEYMKLKNEFEGKSDE